MGPEKTKSSNQKELLARGQKVFKLVTQKQKQKWRINQENPPLLLVKQSLLQLINETSEGGRSSQI